jgi:hypothetical protein
MAVFTINAETVHTVGDHTCPECADEYPEPCPCGGLIHAEPADELDADGAPVLVTRCDSCGRSEDDDFSPR